MRENRLTPFLEPRYKIDGSLEIPLERAKDQLEKHTRYWPMIISQTTIFNMQAVSNLGCVNFCSVPRLSFPLSLDEIPALWGDKSLAVKSVYFHLYFS